MHIINELERLLNGNHVRDNSTHQDSLRLLSPGKNEVSKLYLHVFRDYRSTVTGFLREHLLPGRWKAVYVRDEKGFCAKVLVSKGAQEGELPKSLEKISQKMEVLKKKALEVRFLKEDSVITAKMQIKLIYPEFSKRLMEIAPGIQREKDGQLERKQASLQLQQEGYIYPKEEQTARIQLHICKDYWSSFTGFLREHLLPWKWKVAHLHLKYPDLFNADERVLVATRATNIYQGILPREIEDLLGKTPFEAALILNGGSSIGKQEEEFLYAKNLLGLEKSGPEGRTFNSITPFGKDSITMPNHRVAHIFRARSLASSIGYQLLKWFSSDWKEVTLTVSNISEKILIKKEDEGDLRLFPKISLS